MDLIIERDGAILLRQRTNLLNRANTSTHRINALKGNDLRGLEGVLLKPCFKVCQVVMFEYLFGCTGVADSVNHGRVIELVRKDNAIRQFGSEGGERSIIGDVA